MVAGHLEEKNGFFTIVLNYRDEYSNRKTKSIKTNIPIKGNKKKADALLAQTRNEFKIPGISTSKSEMLFSDFIDDWLEIVKPNLAPTTYASYRCILTAVISPYFKKRNITLRGLKAQNIQAFYTDQLKRVKASTVIHYHSVIHEILKYALKIDLIDTNPADKVKRPRVERFKANFYDSKEIEKVFEICKGTYLEVPVLLGAFYGLRRSEVVGLRWESINFEKNTLTIEHTVTQFSMDGHSQTSAQDTTKTKASLRTLPLVAAFREKLLAIKAQQEVYRELCGRGYEKKYLGYICVNQIGELISPNYITQAFPKLLEKHNMRRIRFHDLRHSCASLLLANGVQMKQIQEWLGHSDFATTANIYAHLDYNSKMESAQAMQDGLSAALSDII